MQTWECPSPVSGARAFAGNNSVTLTWSAPDNASSVDITDYFVQVASDGRVMRVDAATTAARVSGLRNGIEESFAIYAATEHGRSEASSVLTATPTSGMDGEVAGLIVKFTDGNSVTDGQASVPGENRVSSLDLTADVKIADDVHLIELSESVSTEQATEVAAELQSDPSVEWAEPDVFVFPSSFASDPEYESSQWNLWDEWGVGFDLTTGATSAGTASHGAGVTVAVIDTGITSHPDLNSQLVPGYDFVSDPANLAAPRVEGGPDVGFDADGQSGRDADPTDPGDWRGVTPVRDSTWHGTQVAGIIAAQAGNSEGIVGVAPGAKIQPIRALSWRGGLMSDIISSITWASGGSVDGAPANANPAAVITMSFAAQAQCSVALQDAIDDATDRGSILVAAAGNANSDVAGFAPANCSNVIAVGATGRDGKRAPYSNYGPGIDISAPGGSGSGDSGVLSTSNGGVRSAGDADYSRGEGTSIAAAHVAGAIARVRSAEPGLTVTDLRARFLSGKQVRAFPDEQCDVVPNIDCGTGLLTLAQVSSLPAGVTITGGPQYTIEVDCNVITGNPTVYIAHHPGEQLFTPSYMLCGNFLSVNKYNAEAGGGGVKLGFPSEILPNSIFSGTSITIVYYYALRTNQGTRSLLPSNQTISGLAGSPLSASKAITADDFSDVPTYSISPPLPNGLTMDPVTGVISGTPTSAQTATTYTITGSYGTEAASTSASITVNQYRVGFNRGGATSGPSAMLVVNSGDQITLPSISRPSYSFNGWYTEATGGTRVGGIGDAYSVTESLTLYAQWTPPYIVIFNSQGGSSKTAANVTPGSALTLSTNPTRSGLTFAGWFDAPIGGNLIGKYNDTFTPTTSTTLYAQWTANLTLNLGGGSLPASTPTSQTLDFGAGTSVPVTLPTPTRSGYRFRGWYSSSSGGSPLGIGGSSYNVTKTITIYAQWLSLQRVDFDLRGGTLADQRCEFVSGQCRIWWGSGDPALALPTPTSSSGLTFDGWYTASSGGTRRGGGGYQWSTPTTTTLRAQWSGVRTYDPSGGTVGTPSVTGKSGSYAAVPLPYRPGYAFQNWKRPNNQAVTRDRTSYIVEATETWTAEWQQYPDAPILESASLSSDRTTLTLRFSDDVRSIYGSNPSCSEFLVTSSHQAFNGDFSGTCTVTGSEVSLTSNSPLQDSSLELEVAYKGKSLASNANASDFVHQTGNLRVANVGFQVTFDGNGGTSATPSRGIAAGRPIALPDATRSGLDFLGWYDSASRGSRVGRGNDSFTPARDRTLYAQWQGTIEFDIGGTGANPPDDVVNVSDTPETTLPKVTRPGFVFLGWYSEASGGERVGYGGDPYTVTKSTKLHGRWRVIPAVPPGGGGPPATPAPRTPPRLDVRPPRIDLELPARPTPARPAAVIIDGQEVELVVERDEENTELDVTGDSFALTVATADTERRRIAPTAQRSLVAPVRGFVDVQANGYAPASIVSLYLVPRVLVRASLRNDSELYFLGETSVGDDQTFADGFQLPDWALAGEYSLQINGYTPAGALKSINLRLDLIDRRADAVSVARACVFPDDSVQLTPDCRQSLRSLKQVLPAEVDSLTLDITGVAYAQGSKKRNKEVALERAQRVERFLERNGIVGDVTVDVVMRKGLAPGLTLGPPPVVVGESGKPASTVVLTLEWTTQIGSDIALSKDSSESD